VSKGLEVNYNLKKNWVLYKTSTSFMNYYIQ
jgi:hypothetical protein